MNSQPVMPRALHELRLYGVIDVLRPEKVAGWVIDRTDPARCAQVELRREGRTVATLAADRHRPDLERQSVGTGRYGFVFTLDPPLEEGMEFTVAVTATTPDGASLALQPVGAAAQGITPQTRALGHLLAEIVALREETTALTRFLEAAEAGRERLYERLELTQVRLERRLPEASASVSAAPGWLTAVAVTGAAIAVVSLAFGLSSFWPS